MQMSLHLTYSGARSARITIRNSNNPSSIKATHQVHTRCYLSMCGQLYRWPYLSHYVMERQKKKVMRKLDFAPNLDNPLVSARRHQQMAMKCAYSSAELKYSVPRARGQTSHQGFRCLISAKPREQIICNLRFEREVKLVRLQLNSNSQHFAICDQLAKKQYRRAKALPTEGNCYNSSSWRGGLSENRLERKRQSDQRKKEVKVVKRFEKNAQESQKHAKIGRIRREERERE